MFSSIEVLRKDWVNIFNINVSIYNIFLKFYIISNLFYKFLIYLKLNKMECLFSFKFEGI